MEPLPSPQIRDIASQDLGQNRVRITGIVKWGEEEYSITYTGKLEGQSAQALLENKIDQLTAIKFRFLDENTEKIRWNTETNKIERFYTEPSKAKKEYTLGQNTTDSIEEKKEKTEVKYQETYSQLAHLENKLKNTPQDDPQYADLLKEKETIIKRKDKLTTRKGFLDTALETIKAFQRHR